MTWPRFNQSQSTISLVWEWNTIYAVFDFIVLPASLFYWVVGCKVYRQWHVMQLHVFCHIAEESHYITIWAASLKQWLQKSWLVMRLLGVLSYKSMLLHTYHRVSWEAGWALCSTHHHYHIYKRSRTTGWSFYGTVICARKKVWYMSSIPFNNIGDLA